MTLPVADILQPLVDVAEAIIVFLHDDAAFGWGMAIIGLTFIVRLAVLPLSLRGIRSMRRMQLIAPQLQELREKYKDDPQRFQRETMSLYREHGVNPFSSCLPFLLQIPFFIAIYNLLRGDAFREDVQAAGGEGFLFVESVITDPKGAEMVILIALFIVTTALTFLLTMATSQTASRGQRAIFMILPLAIAPFMATLPAGLSVYWIATNVFSLGQQAVVQKLMPTPTPPSPEEAKAVKPPPPPPRKRKRRR